MVETEGRKCPLLSRVYKGGPNAHSKQHSSQVGSGGSSNRKTHPPPKKKTQRHEGIEPHPPAPILRPKNPIPTSLLPSFKNQFLVALLPLLALAQSAPQQFVIAGRPRTGLTSATTSSQAHQVCMRFTTNLSFTNKAERSFNASRFFKKNYW